MLPRTLLLALCLVLVGCGLRRVRCSERGVAKGPVELLCEVPGFKDRDFFLHVPPGYDGQTPLPVVLALHGGGGNREAALRLTCPEGNLDSPRCLDGLADRAGFALVLPDGTGASLAPNVRTWNAGGGVGDWKCVSGNACRAGVDERRYFEALFAELEATVRVDPSSVYATGLSNGAAMSHRLACEFSDKVAAIAAVGGTNQLAAVQGCKPSRPVPVLQIHGTEDPCWGYEGGAGGGCIQDDDKAFVSVVGSTLGTDQAPGWARRNGCNLTPLVESLPDAVDDGTTAVRESYPGCQQGADVVLLRIEGGGHTWPQGHGYFSEKRIGRTCQDFSANETIWDFFVAHKKL